MNFCKNLKSYREQQGLTQGQLAELLEISQPQIAQYERGTKQPSIVILENMCEIFGCSADSLIGISGAVKNTT